MPAADWIDLLERYVTELRTDSFVYWPVAGQEQEQLRLFVEDVMPAVLSRVGGR